MGSFDGVEICALAGLFLFSGFLFSGFLFSGFLFSGFLFSGFLFSGLAFIIGKSDVGLYSDNGLALLENIPGPDTERIKKKIIKFFQQNGLKITFDANVAQTNFLDLTFDLRSDKYWLYQKLNDHPL